MGELTTEQVIEFINEWENSGSIGGDMAAAARECAEEAAQYGDETAFDGAWNAVDNIVSEGQRFLRALTAFANSVQED